MTIEQIAEVCHEANRALCHTQGDDSQAGWELAPKWQRSSAIDGVRFHIANPFADASASHEAWLEEKRRTGWKYGPVKDPETRQHPCFVPFEQLPIEQQAKDYLFRNIVHAFMSAGALEP